MIPACVCGRPHLTILTHLLHHVFFFTNEVIEPQSSSWSFFFLEKYEKHTACMMALWLELLIWVANLKDSMWYHSLKITKAKSQCRLEEMNPLMVLSLGNVLLPLKILPHIVSGSFPFYSHFWLAYSRSKSMSEISVKPFHTYLFKDRYTNWTESTWTLSANLWL